MFDRYIRQSSSGYSLLIALGLITLFTVLGLSLLTLTMSGNTKNSNREDITQALNFAEKAQDFIITDINTKLSEGLSSGISRDDFLERLHDLQNFKSPYDIYKCQYDSNGKLTAGINVSISDSTDTSIACIKEVLNKFEGDPSTLNELKKTLKIVSVGVTDGKAQYLTSEVDFGSENFPEQLKYAITTKDNGNIHLNGGVHITGDIKIGGSLTTYNKAHIIKTYHYWVNSTLPSIKSTSNIKSPRIVVNKDSKFYSVTSSPSNSSNSSNSSKNESIYNGIHSLKPSEIQEKKTEDISKIFDSSVFKKAPTVVSSNSQSFQENISSYKASYSYTRDNANDLIATNGNVPIGKHTGKNYLVYESCNKNSKCSYTPGDRDTTYSLKSSTYEFNQLATSGNLRISGDGTKVKVNNSLYVDGDLTIGNTNTTSSNLSTYDDITLDGSIYVNGDLIIRGVNLKSNALIYVNGKVKYGSGNEEIGVDIQYSTIQSLPYIVPETNIQKNGTLVVFSNKKVKISNNSVFTNNPSKIYGYFYSEKELEIYGVGSNIVINGGVFGSRITLHAIRGEAEENSKFPNPSGSYNGWYFTNSNSQNSSSISQYSSLSQSVKEDASRCNAPESNGKVTCYNNPSRLQINYNKDVIETYIEKSLPEVIIYKLDPPNVISRN